MSRIGVISDTHGPLSSIVFDLFNGDIPDDELQNMIRELYVVSYEENGISLLPIDLEDAKGDEMMDGALKSGKADLIVHAGDIGPQSVLDELGAIAHTIAVLGNNDYDRFMASDGFVNAFRTLMHDGVEIAVAHIPTELNSALYGRGALRPACIDHEVDLAIHGHTHIPRVDIQQSHIVLCPGSPTRARNGSGHNVAIVDTKDGKISAIAIVEV